MIRMVFIFQDILFYCINKVPKNHNQFGYFRHRGETHFLVLAQTLIYVGPLGQEGLYHQRCVPRCARGSLVP